MQPRQILILLFFAQTLLSQSYTPFDMDSVRWFMEDVSPVLGPGDAHSYWEEWIDGDTTVNNILYRKVYSRNLCSSTPDRQNNGAPIYRSPSNGEVQLIGGLREEDKRVYFLRFEGAEATSFRSGFWTIIQGNEYLLYDFNATIGDSIWHGELQWIEVINGDTTFHTIHPRSIVLREKDRNGLRVQENANNTTFISQEYDVVLESRGSRAGLLGPLKVNLNSIRCYFPEYTEDDECPVCPGISTSIDHSGQENINIYPNPTQGVLNLEGDYVEYEIWSSNGTLITYGPSTPRMDLSPLVSGLYYLKVKRKRSTSIHRLIIQ